MVAPNTQFAKGPGAGRRSLLIPPCRRVVAKSFRFRLIIAAQFSPTKTWPDGILGDALPPGMGGSP